MRLVTISEVLTAFTNTESFDESLIKDAIIEATQLRWILPVLGDDLWDEISDEWDTTGDSSGFSVTNLALFNRLISPMKFFVKYEVIPDISVNQSSAGLQVLNTEFSSAATDAQRGSIRENSLTHAQTHLKEFIRWIEHEDNLGDYPLYINQKPSKTSVKTKGGIVF